MKLKKVIIASGITAVVLLLLFACKFNIVLQETDNDGLVFITYGKTIYGIDPEDDELKVIYETSFFPGGVAESDGRLYVGDYLSKTSFGDVGGQSIQVIESDGNAGQYFDTVSHPGCVTICGDYLFVGSYSWSASTGEAYYIIHNKDSLETICEGRFVQGILNTQSMVEYKDGILLTLGYNRGFGDGRIYYLSGEDLNVTETWTVKDYPSLSYSSGLSSIKYDSKLFITSFAEESISIIPLPLGSGDETVINVMELLEKNDDTAGEYALLYKGVIDNKYYGFIIESNGLSGILFILNLDTMQVEVKKEMANEFEEIPTAYMSISNNKLYTYIEGDCNARVPDDVDVIWVFSADDFSFIKEISLTPDKNDSRTIIY